MLLKIRINMQFVRGFNNFIIYLGKKKILRFVGEKNKVYRVILNKDLNKLGCIKVMGQNRFCVKILLLFEF